MVLRRDVDHPPVDRRRGIIDPGIEAAEPLDRGAGDPADVLLVAHVRDDGDGLASPAADLVRELIQRLPIACGQHEPRTPRGGQPGRREPDPRRCARDDDDLFVELLQVLSHVDLLTPIR